MELLASISMEDIAQKRAPDCKSLELFGAMLLRAVMSHKECIVIVTPFSLITSLVSIDPLIELTKKLPVKKDIIIADMKNNLTNYESEECRIIE